MESMKLHRVNFFNPQPKAIKSISFDRTKYKIAVSRSDSSVELWNLNGRPYLEKICPGLPSVSIEALTWCSSRLFSVGLSGHIYEHDLSTLFPMNQVVVTSGASIWCVKEYQGEYLATGNEDGQVAIHKLSADGLNFEKKLDRQEGSILCLDWHPKGEVIVTGSVDAIRVWDVFSGRVINRIMMTRAAKNVPTVVWCIAILSDMTIISGDSCSKTSFWDGYTGTLIMATGPKERHDILAMCVNEEEDGVFISGVDPTVTLYKREYRTGLWKKDDQQVPHTHDVRALAMTEFSLISGGDDCNLVFTKLPFKKDRKTIGKFFPFCQKSYTMTVSDPPCILLQYFDCIEVWSLVKSTEPVSKGPVNLLRIKTKEEERIITSAISPDGKYLAYSSQTKLRLFRINLDTSSGNPTVQKIALPTELESAARILLFTSNPCSLITYSQNKYSFIECDPEKQPSLLTTIDDDPGTSGETHLMELSKYNKYLACGTLNGHVKVYDLISLTFLRLPRYNCPPTAIKFNPNSENLVVAYSDRKVVEYDLKKGGFTKWSKDFNHLAFQESHHTIQSICFIANRMLMQDERMLYIFDQSKDVWFKDAMSIRKRKSNEDMEDKNMEHGEENPLIKNYEHISSIHTCQEDLVLVHHSRNKILDFLPPPIYKKKFGT